MRLPTDTISFPPKLLSARTNSFPSISTIIEAWLSNSITVPMWGRPMFGRIFPAYPLKYSLSWVPRKFLIKVTHWPPYFPESLLALSRRVSFGSNSSMSIRFHGLVDRISPSSSIVYNPSRGVLSSGVFSPLRKLLSAVADTSHMARAVAAMTKVIFTFFPQYHFR